METEAIKSMGTMLQQTPKPSEGVEAGRKELAKGQSDIVSTGNIDNNSIQPEEILNQIKALTEDGLYSVRFENSQEFNEMIVKVMDSKTDEVIRQFPAEEILGMRASLEKLRGQLVNTTT